MVEMKDVQASLERLAEAVVRQMQALLTAAQTHNRVELSAIVQRDRDIDALELGLDRVCRSFMELRAPLGPDFRYVLGALDIARNLERIGDCIEYVARHLLEAEKLPAEFASAWSQLISMMDKCNDILGKAFMSWHRTDARLAKSIPEQDDFVDALQESVYGLIINEVRRGRVDVELGMIVMLVTNKLESIADIACHIAETVVFMIMARQIRHGAGAGAAEV
jgi:phosphate transport system protein